jgi:hypothetical protein
MPKKSVKKAVKKPVKKSVKKSVKKNPKKSAVTQLGKERQRGLGKYGGYETKVIRVPVFLEQEIRDYAIQKIKSEKSTTPSNK